MTAQDYKTKFGGSKGDYALFTRLDLAMSYAHRVGEWVVQSEKHWVVTTPKIAARMERAGLEIIAA